MATSKTLTPTNVTIQIPEFTDQPDQRVNSNCIDKEADAINALNGNIEINDYSSQVTATGSYYNSIMLKKAGNVKMLVLTIFAGNTVIPANVDTVIATIPAACRPINGIGSVYSNIDGHLFNFIIGSNGDITISQPVENNKINGRYVITYI